MKQQFIPIRFAALAERGLNHPRVLGQFAHDQLTCKVANEADDMVEWRRQPGKTPADFEDRIIADLCESMRAHEPAPAM